MPTPPRETLRSAAAAWWPLAASWMLMGMDMPAASAVIARLPEPVVGLAALGGVIYPIAFVVEGPIISLLSASNALCGDIETYRFVRRFTLWAAGVLTAVHLLIALTPLYGVVVDGLIGVPPEVSHTARIGLIIMSPWTAAIAWRRFQQGVLIRFGRSGTVGLGTGLRMLTNVVVLGVGWTCGLPGIVVGTLAIACGVIAEAVYASVVVRAVRDGPLVAAPIPEKRLSWPEFARFYTPLALSPLLMFLVSPLSAAGLSRMPDALPSLACWPVVGGFIFFFRCWGQAVNEVIVARLRNPGGREALLRFTILVAVVTGVLFALSMVTPVARLWFDDVSGLSPDLLSKALVALPLALAIPVLSVAQQALQGVLVVRRRTRGITEGVFAHLAITVLALGAGVAIGRWAGLPVGLVALTAGLSAQVGWLGWRVGRYDPFQYKSTAPS